MLYSQWAYGSKTFLVSLSYACYDSWRLYPLDRTPFINWSVAVFLNNWFGKWTSGRTSYKVFFITCVNTLCSLISTKLSIVLNIASIGIRHIIFMLRKKISLKRYFTKRQLMISWRIFFDPNNLFDLRLKWRQPTCSIIN